MTLIASPAFPRFGVLLLCLLALGCASTEEAGSDAEAPARPRPSTVADQTLNLGLEAPVDGVQALQLYPYAPRAGTPSERELEALLPVLPLRPTGAVRQLRLEFDIMEPTGRPLSVYFYHADRTWERDLFPGEYLTSFGRDDLLDYQSSLGTQVAYTHYTYDFPNDNIGFRVSGNYVLRVTEQGDEDAVLFELPFFITEDATSLNFALDDVFVGGQRAPSLQPFVRFAPPSTLTGTVFDYNVCFVRNTNFDAARCSSDPSLAEQPDLVFFLDPERSFEPEASEYVLDLRSLRQGGDIRDLDFTTVPYTAELEPDYAQFPASGAEPFLNGQSLISTAVRDVADADLSGEYVEAQFSFVPPNEQRLPGGLFVTGSFNAWTIDLNEALDWVAERGRYEGSALVKQGLYEYRYVSPNRAAQRALRVNLPRTANQYTAFVYFSDTSLSTDRLLAIGAVRTN